jgi:imidazolonepropionase-like amidohydrolase
MRCAIFSTHATLSEKGAVTHVDQPEDLGNSSRAVILGEDRTLLLRGGAIYDPHAGTFEQGTVLVSGGIIQAVYRQQDRLPASAQAAEIVDVEGRFVLPGLIDLHVHNTGHDRSRPLQDHLPRDFGLKVLRAAIGLQHTLEAGFTTVRSLGHGSPEVVEQLKAALSAGLVRGPRLFSCGWAISQSGGHGNLHAIPFEWVEQWRPLSGFADGADGCRTMVRRNFGMGADVIKIYTSEGTLSGPSARMDIPNFTVEEIRAMSEEAHRRGKRVAAHAVGEEGIELALQGGVDTIEHGVDAADRQLEEMARRDVTLIPTLSVFHRSEERQGWNRPGLPLTVRQVSLVKRASAAGVRLGCGTDSDTLVAGRNATEPQYLVDAGLSPQKALAATTVHGASALGMAGRLGEIREGFLADVLVLNVNPLDDLRALQRPSAIWRVFRSALRA